MSLFARAGERRTADLSGFFQDGSIPAPAGGGRVTVTTESSMRLSSVWACVRLLSDLVSNLPIHAYRRIDGVPVQIAPPRLLVEPAADMGIDEWLSSAMISALLRGNTYGEIVARGPDGNPTQVELVHPDAVSVRVLRPSGEIAYRFGSADVASSRVMHFRARRMPGSPCGMGPVAYAASLIGLGLSVEEFGRKWFQDGAHPSAVLTSDQKIDEAQAKTIKARFRNAVWGTREPVVLGSGTAYKPIQVAPNESQFLETTRANVADVSRYFGVPPELIGGSSGSSLTYANVEQRSIDLLTYTADWWLSRWERWLTRQLPDDQYVKFNRAAFLRTDSATRAAVIDKRLRNGTLNADEARALEDQAPLPDGAGRAYIWPPAPAFPVAGTGG